MQAQITTVTAANFEDLCIAVFRYQAEYNSLYKKYLHLLHIDTQSITTINQIPFLPISFFKTHRIKTKNWRAEVVFTSSGTTGNTTSRHYVKDTTFYDNNTRLAYENFYGALKNYTVLALLPAYLERGGSSLVRMAQRFIEWSDAPESGFFLYEYNKLQAVLQECNDTKKPTLLLGVSFALLDLAEQYPLQLADNIIVMETGGMKGRRRELTRPELHDTLARAFGTSQIHSEYGMTELLSQAYSQGNGRFTSAPTMRVQTRELTDPFTTLPHEQTGCLNIIDLANLHSCSFIATDDLGKTHSDGSFEVLGRADASDIRGCNLLV